MFGYSFVNGYRKDREMAKSDNIEKSGHLVKILGKVINTKYSKNKDKFWHKRIKFYVQLGLAVYKCFHLP